MGLKPIATTHRILPDTPHYLTHHCNSIITYSFIPRLLPKLDIGIN